MELWQQHDTMRWSLGAVSCGIGSFEFPSPPPKNLSTFLDTRHWQWPSACDLLGYDQLFVFLTVYIAIAVHVQQVSS